MLQTFNIQNPEKIDFKNFPTIFLLLWRFLDVFILPFQMMFIPFCEQTISMA